MSKPDNSYLLHKIKASITAGIRPCAMVFRAQPTDPWEAFDFALIEAYQSIQDETCSQCGNPVWLCRSDSNVFHFRARQSTCYATKSLEEAKNMSLPAKERAKADVRKQWGRFWYTDAELYPLEKESGTALPTRRDYYESLLNRG